MIEDSVDEAGGAYLKHSHVSLWKVKMEAGDESLHVVSCVLFPEWWLEGHDR